MKNDFTTYFRLDWKDPLGNEGYSNLFYGCAFDEEYMINLVKQLNKEYPNWKHSYKIIELY